MINKPIKKDGVLYLPEYYSLHKCAERMRRNPTESEKDMCIWLKRKKANFKSQVPISCGERNYIADIVIYREGKPNVILEVDGGYHNNPQQNKKDVQRTKDLESKGYKVVRISNDGVKRHNFGKIGNYIR